jgi:GNAT superfamily N-acetyltransferase
MIRRINANETIAVRWPVLRPGFPRESAVFAGDELATTIHFGAFDGERLAGVASIYLAPLPERPDVAPAWQLRGMATLPEVRGMGFGRELLDACVAHARGEDAGLIWCNARTGAAPFYSKHGWTVLGEEFEIPTVGPHFRMLLVLDSGGPG